MSKLWLIIPFALLLTDVSCKKVDEATEFDINYSSRQSVPGSSLSVGAQADVITPDIETDSQKKFSSNGTAKDLISAIKLTRLTVTNESGNLDFLNSFVIYIRADGLNELEVARKDQVPKGATTVEADVTGNNIKEHVFKEKIRFRISLVANSLPAEEQWLRIEETMRVSGKKLSR